jgi:hypothetical protein
MSLYIIFLVVPFFQLVSLVVYSFFFLHYEKCRLHKMTPKNRLWGVSDQRGRDEEVTYSVQLI